MGNKTRGLNSWREETAQQVRIYRSITTSLRKDDDGAKGKGTWQKEMRNKASEKEKAEQMDPTNISEGTPLLRTPKFTQNIAKPRSGVFLINSNTLCKGQHLQEENQ